MAERARGFRPEIQALRALSVLAVIVFHLWPNRLTGGYVGVDVFFVISGFLITSHLFRELESTGRLSLSRFYARRVRRLLPAAMLVLAVSAVGVLTLTAQGLWRPFLTEIGASAVYVVNWVLAFNSVDYFASENEASPVQHYWSLSVEEQFYLVWPLLMLIATVLATRSARRAARGTGVLDDAQLAERRRRAWLLVILLVFVAGFAYSVIVTPQAQQFAYFATPAHAWEFAAGALLALLSARLMAGRWQRAEPLRAAASWLGLAAIIVPIVTFTGQTLFPGWIAAIPVAGAILVMAAGVPTTPWAPTRLLSLRPVQFIGDISYAAYLWHWPLIVFGPALLGRELSSVDKVVIFAVTIVLAWLTKLGIEDPIIRGVRWRPRRVSFGFAAVASAAIIALCAVPVATLEAQAAQTRAEIETRANDRGSCLGANALLGDEECKFRLDMDPALGSDPKAYDVPELTEDRSAGDAPVVDECRDLGDDEVRCVVGSTAPQAVIAIIGDSHAEAYEPALTYQPTQRDWQIRTYTKRSCPIMVPEWTAPDDVSYKENRQACRDWRADIIDEIANDPDVDVVVGASYARRWAQTGSAEARQQLTESFAATWRAFADAGKQVVVMGDVPLTAPDSILGCVQEGDPAERCSLERADALIPDPMLASAELVDDPAVSTFDPTDGMCDADRCYVAIGGLVAYLDSHHLTPAFARTFGSYLTPVLDAAVKRAG